ncbi:MAG: endonuclease/exonuclease/phosphatase family protein [Clostridia bacterium]|nr:endonuclease/exonuclease/phosphatase family protein [Clostridia bacterium]
MADSFLISLTRFFLSLSLSLTSFFLPSGTAEANPMPPTADGADLRVVTFNLRCIGIGKTSVAYRAPLLAAQLNEANADSIGVQEATLQWMTYLRDHLDGYESVGVSRTNGKNRGEFSAIFYKVEKYDLLDSGTFWLSKTPDVAGSSDWGSANIRICTWAILQNKETKQTYVHFNTHLDHVSDEARTNQMRVLLEQMKSIAGDLPVVLTGDFNAGNDSDMYRTVADALQDSRLTARETDDQGTFHSYGAITPKLIDYIFVSDTITPLVYHVMDDKINDAYLSDHYGIYLDLKLAE